jgi:hypothetical protein
MTHAVTGTGLISLARDFADAPKSTMVAAAGYIRPDGKLAWTAFYEALLAAKGINPVVSADEDEEYEELSDETKGLYHQIHEQVGEKWGHVEIMEFMGHVRDLGIERADYFGEALAYVADDPWHWHRDFINDYCLEADFVNDAGIHSWLVIDYEATWESNLRYDYQTVEYDGSVYVFRNDF